MAAHPYDIKLTVGATEYGFMLVTPKGESKQLQIGETPLPEGQYNLVRQSSDTVRVHTDFDPKFDQPLAQQTFSGGVGQLEMDASEGDITRYWWSEGVVTRADGVVCLAPQADTISLPSGSGNITGFTTWLTGGTRYDFCWQGPRLYRRDAANRSNAWALVYTASVDITDFKIIDTDGYIAVPTHGTATTDFLYQADPTAAATWTPAAVNHTAFSDVLGKPSFFEKIRGWTYAFVSPRKVFYTSAPTTDAWVGPIDTSLSGNTSGPPGDLTYNFVGTSSANDFLMAFKTDAAYNIDAEQEVTEVIAHWKTRPATENFEFVAAGGDLIYYSSSPEVYAYDPGTGRNLPLQLTQQAGFSVKQVLGVAADNDSVYVLAKVRVPHIRSADSAALLRGTKAGASRWAFEVLWEDTASTSYYRLGAVPTAAYGTRLYWGKSTQTYVMDCPAEWNETSSGTDGYEPGGKSIYMSIWRTGFPNFMKRWLWLATRVTIASGSSMTAQYSTDMGATWTVLASLTTSTLVFTNFSSVNAEHIILRFSLGSNGDVTPILHVYDLHGRVRWRYLPAPVAAVRIADNLELNNGVRDSVGATTLVSNINTLRTTDSTILYEDFLGNSFNVSLESYSYRPSRHNPQELILNPYELEAVMHFARADSGA